MHSRTPPAYSMAVPRPRHVRRPLPPDLADGILRRAFQGDARVLDRFLALLREPLSGSEIVLRGSSVSGESYRGREAFDARGPGTSDLDLVALGHNAMELWRPDAFYLRGVNTFPLSDESPWVAPTLEPARLEAQRMVGRPVNIQAMAAWFLEIRALLKAQRHVILAVPAPPPESPVPDTG